MLLYAWIIILFIMGAFILFFHVRAILYNKEQEHSLIGTTKDIWPYIILWILWFITLLFTLLLLLKRRNIIDDHILENTIFDTSKKTITDNKKENENNGKYIDDSIDTGNKKNIVIVDEKTKNQLKGNNYKYIPITSGYYELITDNNTIISKNVALGSYEIPSPVINNYCTENDKFWNIRENGLDYNGFIYDYLNGKKSERVVVAIIDSGIDTDNKTLMGHISKNKKETINGKDDDGDGYIDNLNGINVELLNGNIKDELGHGTHIAGIVLQTFPNAELLPIKVSNFDNHTVSEVSLIEGIRYAIDHQVDIINLSLGSNNTTEIEHAMIKEATNKGIIVVAAAGNAGIDTKLYFPAGYDEVLSVGSIGQDGVQSRFSNLNATTNLPGECIYSYGLDTLGVYMDGTSMSSPHLAGIIGALKSIGNTIGTGIESKSLISKSTRKVGTSNVIQMSKLLGITNENKDVSKNINLIESSLSTIKKDLENLKTIELNESKLKTVAAKGDSLLKNANTLADIYSKLSINTGFGIKLQKDISDYVNLLTDLNLGDLYLTVDGGTLTSSLGIDTCSPYPNCDVYDPIIYKGTKLPSSNTKYGYTTVFDYQSKVEFKIYQGDNSVASKNNYLGVVSISIPSKKVGEVKIKVNFDVHENGKLDVSAEDQSNPNSKVPAKIIKNVQKESYVITGENYYKVQGIITDLINQTDVILKEIGNFKGKVNPFDYIPQNIEGAYLRDSISNNAEKTITGTNNVLTGNLKDFSCDLSKCEYGKVTNIVDGDTIDMGSNRIRLLGINTPETVDPEKEVECYGPEATQKMKELVLGKNVCACRDNISDNKDKYDRLLRYIYLDNGDSVNEIMLKEGYSAEYSKYDFGLKNKYAQIANNAKAKNIGVYKCGTTTTVKDEKVTKLVIPETTKIVSDTKNCNIKGNINGKGEKIYHVPGCENYNDTIITPSKGEKWFCTEEEARAAGWRKAKNC